jgi:hypothetical protein
MDGVDDAGSPGSGIPREKGLGGVKDTRFHERCNKSRFGILPFLEIAG